MIIAVDTNILLDIWLPDPAFGPQSWEALMLADALGGLVICEVVYAELSPRFPVRSELDHALELLDIIVEPTGKSVAHEAGHAWQRYRHAGGKRTRIMADFLIGAHAAIVADQFITRDEGFYRGHFSQLQIVNPGRA